MADYGSWYIPDGDEEIFASVSVASGSNADPDVAPPAAADFQVVILLALGIICGILLAGSRRLS